LERGLAPERQNLTAATSRGPGRWKDKEQAKKTWVGESKKLNEKKKDETQPES